EFEHFYFIGRIGRLGRIERGVLLAGALGLRGWREHGCGTHGGDSEGAKEKMSKRHDFFILNKTDRLRPEYGWQVQLLQLLNRQSGGTSIRTSQTAHYGRTTEDSILAVARRARERFISSMPLKGPTLTRLMVEPLTCAF